MHSSRLVLIAAIMLFASRAYCQKPITQPNLETDRPDQTEAASVVPFKTMQLETGFYFQKDKAGSTELTHKAYPATLVRFGILNWLELRAEGACQKLIIKDEIESMAEGFGPLSVGAKVKLWEGKGVRPQAAFMGMAALPVGSDAFKPDDPEVSLRLMFKNSINPEVDLNYNLAYGWEAGKPLLGYAVSIGSSLSDRITVFGEVFGNKPNGIKASHAADAGLLFLLLPNLQLDIAAGTALNAATPGYFITSGLSIRLPG